TICHCFHVLLDRFLSSIPPPPLSTLFPYTTLFRSAQTTPRTESLSLSRGCRDAALGGLGRDRGQSNQYRSVPGGKRHGIEVKMWATARPKREGRKMRERPEPACSVPDLAHLQQAFLRRKVARAADCNLSWPPVSLRSRSSPREPLVDRGSKVCSHGSPMTGFDG